MALASIVMMRGAVLAQTSTVPAAVTPGPGPSADAATSNPQQGPKESGWFHAGDYAFNLINVEYYDAKSHELHFSGQRKDLHEQWAGLLEFLSQSHGIGFVQMNDKFVNMRNLSSILTLGTGHGGSLTFRDGATLPVSDADLAILNRVIQ